MAIASTIVKLQLQSSSSSVFNFIQDEDEACADSGATDPMLPDYGAFISYRKCTNKYVTLGDESRLPIAGIGTAKFSLNKRILIIRNAYHVPVLRSPLYSLRKPKLIPGCGTFSC